MIKQYKNDILLYIIISVFFLFLIMFFIIYDRIKYAKAVKQIEISINGLDTEQLKKVKLYFESPQRGIFFIPMNLDNEWVIKNRYVKKIYLTLDELNINKYDFSLLIDIGNKKIIFDKNELLLKWEKISKKEINTDYILQSPDNVCYSKSKLSTFSKIINWPGDFNLIINSLIKSAMIVFFIYLVFILFIFVKRYFGDYIIKYCKHDITIILFIILSTIIIRILTLEIIDISGDSVWTWFNVKTLSEGIGFLKFDHHTTRIGKIIPLLLIQKLFGYKAQIYYLTTIIYTVISVIMIYKIGKLIHNRFLGIIAAYLFLFFSEINRAASQLIPSMYSICYVLFAVYFLIKYIKNDGKSYLIISSLFLFFAYLAEITNVFFIPGLVIALLLNNKRGFKSFIIDVFIYGSILLILFLIETFIYYKLSGNILGRIGIIKSTHLSPPYFILTSFWQIFNRYIKLSGIWFIVFFSNLVISIILIFNKTDKIIKGLIAVVLIFFTIILFSISKLKPLELSLKFNERYLDVCLPMMFLVIGYFFTVVVRNIIENNTFLKKTKSMMLIHNLIIISIFILYTLYNVSSLNFKFNNNSLILVNKYERIINNAYENKIPIVIFSNTSYADEMFLGVIDYVFLNKNFWYNNKEITFPNIKKINYENKEYSIIMNTNESETQEIFKEYAKNNRGIIVMKSYDYNRRLFYLKEYNFKIIFDHYDYFRN
jgi:hypothetical protein